MSYRLIVGLVLGIAAIGWAQSSSAVANDAKAAAPKAESEAAGGGEQGGGEQGEKHKPANLNPLSLEALSRDLALWTGVMFLIVFAILAKFAWGPLVAGLDKREQGIADHISQAEAANRQAKELLAQYEKRLSDAKDEVRGILEQGRRDAERVGADLIVKAKAEAAAEQQRSLKQIDSATSAAIKELADKAAGLAVDLAGKIVSAKLNARDHAQLIEKAVKDFTQSRN